MSLAVIAGGFAVLFTVWAVYTYNFLIHARNKVRESFSGIDVQLKQRHDLVPNLLDVVRGYADHEQNTLRAVAATRVEAIKASNATDIEQAENRLAGSLGSVIALAENYPDLKASEHFARLIGEITEVEDEIEGARSLYNKNVEFYNSRARSLPAMLVGMWMRPSSFEFLRFESVDLGEASELVGEMAA